MIGLMVCIMNCVSWKSLHCSFVCIFIYLYMILWIVHREVVHVEVIKFSMLRIINNSRNIEAITKTGMLLIKVPINI